MSVGRTHYAGQVTEKTLGEVVTVAGWVHRRRDHGGVLFVDLRDRTGLVQIVCEPSNPSFATLDRVRAEYVLSVHGTVRKRPAGMVNRDLQSGEVEIVPETVNILSSSETPPFNMTDATAVDELLRLKYRYLDLRRPELTRNMILRDQSLTALRAFFHDHGFLDVETPALARSTPEGARDFLVPSRTQPGSFYALPQSPQIFKQLLMVAGLDRYYQIAKVFRDEDLRADRQPEFTQIDVEMSFMDREEILTLMEEMLRHLFRQVMATELPEFPRMSWKEAMAAYGSDKPDLRAGEPLKTLTTVAHQIDWPVFQQAKHVVGVILKQYRPSRRDLDLWVDQSRSLGAEGLVWLVRDEKGTRSSASKWIGDQGMSAFVQTAGIDEGDVLLLLAGQDLRPFQVAGQLRLQFARTMNRMEEGWRFLWVTEFPLFETSEDDGRITSAHHPFTMPHPEDIARIESDPLAVRSEAYDVVLNGVELASGSLRIYEPQLQQRIFSVLGLSDAEISSKFGFFVDAFQYGAPPHGGIAFGLDRLLMLMAGAESIRDVIAFPKTARGTDPLMNAPSPVDESQLIDVHLRIRS